MTHSYSNRTTHAGTHTHTRTQKRGTLTVILQLDSRNTGVSCFRARVKNGRSRQTDIGVVERHSPPMKTDRQADTRQTAHRQQQLEQTDRERPRLSVILQIPSAGRSEG